MRFPIRDAPPAITVRVSYRELYEHGAFAQRELTSDSQLQSLARDRGLARWIGQEVPEDLDRRGALCPVAFVDGGYFSGFSVPAIDPANLTFREEVGAEPWAHYAWDAWGHPEVSPIYSPWQLLYLDVVAREAAVQLPIDAVQAPADELSDKLAPVRPLIDAQRALLEEIDTAWRPLMKLLVTAQNVYWPKVSGRVTVMPAGPGERFADAGDTAEDPRALLARAGCSVEELKEVYYFLVERGLGRESQDGMILLRRSVPREYHVRWRGPARQAQDHFDAAQLLYLWLTDLEGVGPQRPGSWPLDGRHAERMALYDNGPGSEMFPEQLKEQLIAIELYPHGPVVVGEGVSERIIIDWLLQALLGLQSAFEFHDLEGTGAAKRIARLVETFDNYAAEAFVVVDDEGEMARYVNKAIATANSTPTTSSWPATASSMTTSPQPSWSRSLATSRPTRAKDASRPGSS